MQTSSRTLPEVTVWTQEGRDAFAVLLDEFLDAFYTEDTAASRQAMVDHEPPPLDDERTDACVGAVGEHLARRWGLSNSAGTEASWRVVAPPSIWMFRCTT